MLKFYKQKLYKKYQDEIWGNLITSKNFSYNKRSVLMNYKEVVLRRRLRIKFKFKYFKIGFLKHLNYTNFLFKTFKMKLKIFNFIRAKLFFKPTFYNPKTSKFQGFNSRFKKGKLLTLLNFNLMYLAYSRKNLILKTLVSPIFLYKKKRCLDYKKIFPLKNRVMYNSINFLRPNNLQFVIKKKLKLKREKTFFYSIHIAAPRKKKKKWSLFGLKNIYYKKISLFFGFKKISDFIKTYNFSTKIIGRNIQNVFLMLEGRLDNFLFRLNIFPSVYFVKKFIQYGNVFANNKAINYASYVLNFNEIVSFNKRYHKYLYYFIKSSLKDKKVLLNYPDFIEADYKLFVAMLIRSPSLNSLTLPVSFDLYTKFPTVNR